MLRAVLPLVFAVLLGLWAHGPGLSCPRAVDDYAHEAMLDGTWPLPRAPWDLYNFVDGSEREVRALASQGVLPWWSHSHLRFRFLRPLSSLLLALDHRVFRADALGPHLHSLGWWLAACAALYVLSRRVVGPRAAPLAVALFAADRAHTLPLGWLANRSFLVCTALGLCALERLLAFHASRRRRDALAAGALFALALAAGEYALTLLAYAAAFSLVSADRWRDRLRTALPWALPLAAWLLVYRLGHYGADHSDAYLDPLRRPRAFFSEAPARLWGQLGELWFAVPAEGPPPWSWSSLRARLAGATALCALLAALRAMRPVPEGLRWIVPGSALAILPVLPAFGASRLQGGAQVGVAMTLAVLLVRALESLARPNAHGRWIPALTLPPALALMFLHLVASPMSARADALAMCHGHRRELATLRNARIVREGLSRARVILVAAPDGQVLLYTPLIWRSAGIPRPRAWMGLTATAGIYRLQRPAPDTLALEALTGPWLAHQPEAMFRPSTERLLEGDRISLDGVDITVEQRRIPGLRRVTFRFHEPLAPENTRLMVLHAALGLLEVPLPPVGSAWFVPEPRIPESP